MSFPKTPPPQVATDAVWTSGPETGQPCRIAVPLSAQKQGFIAGSSSAAAAANGIVGPMSDHVVALSEIGIRNWSQLVTGGVAALPVTGAQYVLLAAPVVAGNGSNLYVFGSGSGAAVVSRTKQGVEWAAFGSGLGATTRVQDMASNGSFLVAVGPFTGNQSAYSTNDGASFTQVANHSANNYTSVCELSGVFYATGSGFNSVGKNVGNAAWTPTGGSTHGNAQFIRSAPSIGKLLTLSVSNQTEISSDGGVTWTVGASAVFAVGNPVDIRWNPSAGVWMAVSSKFAVATSSDGLNWTLVTAAQLASSVQTIQLATDGNGLWACAYIDSATTSSRIAYSSDGGVTWKQIVVRDVASFYASICYDALRDCFYALFKDTSGTKEPVVLRSLSTGTAWAPVV
jgi:hypothetical protein